MLLAYWYENIQQASFLGGFLFCFVFLPQTGEKARQPCLYCLRKTSQILCLFFLFLQMLRNEVALAAPQRWISSSCCWYQTVAPVNSDTLCRALVWWSVLNVQQCGSFLSCGIRAVRVNICFVLALLQVGFFYCCVSANLFSCRAADCPQSSGFSAPLWAQEVLLFSAKWKRHDTKSLSGFSLCVCVYLIVKLVKIPLCAFITCWYYRQFTLKCYKIKANYLF